MKLKKSLKFSIIIMKKIVQIKGTHCPSCKALIEDVCKDIDGVISCSVDYKTCRTQIECNNKLDFTKLKKEIESLGSYVLGQ